MNPHRCNVLQHSVLPPARAHHTRVRCLQHRQHQVTTQQQQEKQRKVAIFVEPSPFSHISGMKNRFECLIKGLRNAGDDVVVFTPDRTPPKDFHGAQVVNVLGFPLPFYSSPTLLLSLGLSARVMWHLITRRPDIIHVSTPGVLVFAAMLYAKLLRVPLVVSYHTHVPEYIPKYTWPGFVRPMWALIRLWTRAADLTLVTSRIMKDELTANKCHDKQIEIWQRGVDTEVFHPRFRDAAMRGRMIRGGDADNTTLLVYIGRLGAEKNLFQLRDILDRVQASSQDPSRRVALSFVGDGPERAALEAHFSDYPNVTFMGMLQGEELSKAYASGDIFVMPSETETLGFVVLEAMAAGLAVVAVRAGGLRDIITAPGTTGLFYEPGDVDGAATHVQALIADPDKRRHMGLAAREDVAAWGWDAATQRLRSRQYSRAERRCVGRQRVRWRWLRAPWRWMVGVMIALWQWLSGLVGGRVAVERAT